MADDIVVASTTESQAELDHAVSDDWREKFTKPEDAEQGQTESSEAPATGAKTGSESETEHPKSGEGKSKTESDEDKDWEGVPKGARKRIEKLTARLRAAEEELDRRRTDNREPPARRETAEERRNADGNSWDDPRDPEPDIAGNNSATGKPWKDMAEFNRAHFGWLNRQQAREDAFHDWQAQQTQLEESFKEQVTAVRDKYDDFENVAKDAMQYPLEADVVLAVKELPNGAEVLYHLAKSGEAEEFVKLSLRRQIAELGRISASLLPSKSKSQAAPTAKPTSKAPAPTTPVKGSTTNAPMALNDPNISTDEYIRRRNREDAERRRRN